MNRLSNHKANLRFSMSSAAPAAQELSESRSGAWLASELQIRPLQSIFDSERHVYEPTSNKPRRCVLHFLFRLRRLRSRYRR